MSRERSVFGIVVITISLTATVLIGGLLVASRYLNQPIVTTAEDDAPAAAPAPRRKASRVQKKANGPDAETRGSSAEQVDASHVDATSEVSGALQQNEPANTDGEGLTTDADAEAASQSASATAENATAPPAENQTDARAIMEEAQRRGVARFYRYDGLLRSFDAKEKVTEKRWTFDRAGSNGRSKSVLRFTAPAEVKGVALLIHNHPERASDQWMWTPALERDRRIALQDRSTRFFGTDFSFEDLEERDVDQYDYALLGNDTIDGASCWKIEMTPKQSRSSHYSRSIGWIRKDNYVMVRLDNFVEGEVVKRLSNSAIENVQGIWTARQLEMADLRRGTRTQLTLQQVKYNTPMGDGDFTLQAIRH